MSPFSHSPDAGKLLHSKLGPFASGQAEEGTWREEANAEPHPHKSNAGEQSSCLVGRTPCQHPFPPRCAWRTIELHCCFPFIVI